MCVVSRQGGSVGGQRRIGCYGVPNGRARIEIEFGRHGCCLLGSDGRCCRKLQGLQCCAGWIAGVVGRVTHDVGSGVGNNIAHPIEFELSRARVSRRAIRHLQLKEPAAIDGNIQVIPGDVDIPLGKHL